MTHSWYVPGWLGTILICWVLYEIVVLTGSPAWLGKFPSLVDRVLK